VSGGRHSGHEPNEKSPAVPTGMRTSPSTIPFATILRALYFSDEPPKDGMPPGPLRYSFRQNHQPASSISFGIARLRGLSL